MVEADIEDIQPISIPGMAKPKATPRKKRAAAAGGQGADGNETDNPTPKKRGRKAKNAEPVTPKAGDETMDEH